MAPSSRGRRARVSSGLAPTGRVAEGHLGLEVAVLRQEMATMRHELPAAMHEELRAQTGRLTTALLATVTITVTAVTAIVRLG
jgi:hypothetical protein